jgi:hypothetical protein
MRKPLRRVNICGYFGYAYVGEFSQGVWVDVKNRKKVVDSRTIDQSELEETISSLAEQFDIRLTNSVPQRHYVDDRLCMTITYEDSTVYEVPYQTLKNEKSAEAFFKALDYRTIASVKSEEHGVVETLSKLKEQELPETVRKYLVDQKQAA